MAPYPDSDIPPTQPIVQDNPAEKQAEITPEIVPIVSLSPEKIIKIREFQSAGKPSLSTDELLSEQDQGIVRCQCGWDGEEAGMVSQSGPLAHNIGSFQHRYNVLSVSNTSTRDVMGLRTPGTTEFLMCIPVINVYWSRMNPPFFVIWAVLSCLEGQSGLY